MHLLLYKQILRSYPKPERLDIYNNGIYIYPQNYKINEEGNYVAYPPSSNNPKEYYPPINSSTLSFEKYLEKITLIFRLFTFA